MIVVLGNHAAAKAHSQADPVRTRFSSVAWLVAK